ncbi:DUF1647 domain-containing protein [Acidimicrobiia bacterium]|jgi:hypothetical protein|nr:DUF1647 domain-containing protein [Acidimicrobiia bacterium]
MYNHRINRFKIHVINWTDVFSDVLKICKHSLRNLLTKSKLYSTELTIVTGSDFTHYKSLTNLLQSLVEFESSSRVVVYDLGLSEIQKKDFKKNFVNVELIDFQFAKYPVFISQRSKPDNKLGSYAWKPVVIKETIDNYGGSVLWLDAGDVLTKRLTLIKIILTSIGLYACYSPGKISDWTHSDVLKNMNFNLKLINKRNLASGMVGFNSKNKKSLNILNEWFEKAQIEKLIAPKGSSRSNHRQDQALLTLICYKQNIVHKIPSTHKIFGIIVHQDPDKIYVSPVHDDHKLALRENWYETYSDFSTNTLINADIVWLIDFSSIGDFPDKYMKKVKVIASYSKKDSSINEEVLNDNKKYIRIFLVENEEDKQYLNTIGINNIEVTNKFRNIKKVYDIINDNFI